MAQSDRTEQGPSRCSEIWIQTIMIWTSQRKLDIHDTIKRSPVPLSRYLREIGECAVVRYPIARARTSNMSLTLGFSISSVRIEKALEKAVIHGGAGGHRRWYHENYLCPHCIMILWAISQSALSPTYDDLCDSDFFLYC
jgi:hypothetical protein